MAAAADERPAMIVPPKKYQSAFNGKEQRTLVGCAVLPVKYSPKAGSEAAGSVGPALSLDAEADESGFEDVVDEVLYYLKARMYLKTFPLEGAADRLSLYLTLYLQNCVRRLAKQKQPLPETAARQALQTLAAERQTVPGDASYPFNALYPTKSATAAAELEELRDYCKRLRLEAGHRLVDRVYAIPEADGAPNKFWMVIAKQELLGHVFEKW